MKLKNRYSNLDFINTLRGELSNIDTQISNLSLHSSYDNTVKPRSLPPLSTQRPIKLAQKHPNRQARIFKSIEPGCYNEIQFLEKYFNLPSKPKVKKSSNNTLSKPKFFKFQPKILPKATRLDPESNPVLITDEDLQKGIYSLVNLGIATKNSEVFEALRKENPPLVHSKVLLHNFSIQLEPLKLPKKSKEKKQLNFIFSEPIIPNKKSVIEVVADIEKPKNYPIKIQAGFIINDQNFQEFSEKAQTANSIFNLNQLKLLSKQYKLPDFTINSENLPSDHNVNMDEMLKYIENSEEISNIVNKQQQLEAEKKARFKAALKIQCMWRRYKGAARMRRHKLEKGKVRIIEVQYKKYKKKVYTKQFAANLREARSNKFSERQNDLKSSWPELKNKELIEVHIGSCLSQFPIPANQQIFRIFLLANTNISMVYISLQDLDIDVSKYFELLLRLMGVCVEGRLRFITPYTLCRNVMSDTSKAFYLSLHDLVDLKYVNKGKNLVFVPFETNEYDEYLGDFMKAPIMGPVASVYQKYNTLYRWETIKKSGLDALQSHGGIWEFQEFQETLKNLNLKKGKKLKNPEKIFKDWQIWINNKIWTGTPWENDAEIVIKEKIDEAFVLCCLFLDPVGTITHNITVESLPGNSSYLYPQSILPASYLSSIILNFSQFLYAQGVFGYFSIQICSKGIIDFQIGFNNNLPINIFFKHLMKGVDEAGKYLVAAQSASEMEQEMYIDENSNFVTYENFEIKYLQGMEINAVNKEPRVYIWVPLLYHENLVGQKISSIFHMCRLESVLYSLSKGQGVIFLPYGNFVNGSLGLLAVGADCESALEFVAQGIFILKQGCFDGDKGNLEEVARDLRICKKIEEFQKLSEDNQYLLKLL